MKIFNKKMIIWLSWVVGLGFLAIGIAMLSLYIGATKVTLNQMTAFFTNPDKESTYYNILYAISKNHNLS